MPRWIPNLSRRGLETTARDLLAGGELSAGDVQVLTRGNMHTDPVAKSHYDKRSARLEKADATTVYIEKVLPASRKAASMNKV